MSGQGSESRTSASDHVDDDVEAGTWSRQVLQVWRSGELGICSPRLRVGNEAAKLGCVRGREVDVEDAIRYERQPYLAHHDERTERTAEASRADSHVSTVEVDSSEPVDMSS